MDDALDRLKSILLVSCYELGHQPVGVASPRGFLERVGYASETLDIAVEPLDETKVAGAWFVGISVPMHTALRLGVRAAERIREINPECHICFYGLYASLNADYLLQHVADSVIGGEYEEPLVDLIKALDERRRMGEWKNGRIGEWESGRMGEWERTWLVSSSPLPPFLRSSIPPLKIEGVSVRGRPAGPFLKRLSFAIPNRSGLPPLQRYAHLERDGVHGLVGYVEASRGCLHHCLHCPIPPVYGGRFFVVPREIVLADIRNLIRAGATHITFGDPDFLNGPGHSLRVVRAMHEEFPELTFDFTAKVEHLLKHRAVLPKLARLGCVFIVSAVESLSDTVLANLEKGHRRTDVYAVLGIVRDAGIALRPTWVPFTPWATLDDYIDILEFVHSEGLIYHVDPVQYSIRLLVPPGSALLQRPAIHPFLGPLDQANFTYRWAHPDPRLDELHRAVSAVMEQAARADEDPAMTFHRVYELAYVARGDVAPASVPVMRLGQRRRPPRLTEPWFC
jgi:radical SAM superfamily enzyme YgiQ (UPF0313 family)